MSAKISMMFVDYDSFELIEKWLGGGALAERESGHIVIGTASGNVLAFPGDLILKFGDYNIVFTPKLTM